MIYDAVTIVCWGVAGGVWGSCFFSAITELVVFDDEKRFRIKDDDVDGVRWRKFFNKNGRTIWRDIKRFMKKKSIMKVKIWIKVKKCVKK